MRLKRLEILGFKSFADKIRLTFDEGITAIVGPNGCGKSNIADAFRWVLGEQSAKSMRGSKMPDVIFAGTTHRKPLNFAEVTITLSDINGYLPIDYNEVSVTRRLHRSGESDYFINKHPVRLKDVQSLFLDSGMGKDTYSIFEQGKIDQVINFSPLERRYIFEEAAGILRFLQRKKEALRKLEQTDSNLSRVKDIHLEVERQIIVLEEQAEKARVYKENKAKLEILEKSALAMKWEQFKHKSQESQQKGSDQQAQIAALQKQLEVSRLELKKAKIAVEEGEKQLRAKSEEVFKARSEKEIKTKERLSFQERLKEALSREKKWEQELSSMDLKEAERQEEKKGLEKQLVTLEKELAEKEKEVKGQAAKVQNNESGVQIQQDKLRSRQQELFHAIQKHNQSESTLKQNSLRQENLQDKINYLQTRLGSLNAAQVEAIASCQEKQKVSEELSLAVDSQRTSFNGMEITLQQLADELRKNQAEMDHVQQELADGRARQKVLTRLKNEREGFSSGSKKLLQEAENPSSPLYQKLKGVYEYLVPEKDYEEALAAVMRSYAQTLVVEREEDFQSVLSYAHDLNLKDFSIFCMENASTNKSKKDKTQLSAHVTQNPVASHFLEGIMVADDLPTKMAQKDVCTLNGQLVDIRQVYFSTSHSENNVFIREAELKALEARLQELENARKQHETILMALQQKKIETQNQRIELDKNIRRTEMKLVEINFALQRMKSDQEKAVIECGQMQAEIQKLILEIDVLKKAADSLAQQHQKNGVEAKKIQEEVSLLNAELQQIVDEQRKQRQELQQKEAARQNAAEAFARCKHALHVLDVKEQERQQQVKRLEEEIQNCRLLQSQISVKNASYEKILQDVESSLSDVQIACSDYEKVLASSKASLEQIEKKIEDKLLRLNKYEHDYQQLTTQVSHYAASMQNLENEIKERYQVTLEEALQLVGAQTLEITERELRTLRQEIAQIGDINMTSIEECEKNRTRYHFLNQQMDDLNVSKQELVQIIAQLDTESRKIFKKTFELISANFKKNFEILFNGGEADLHFTDTEDVLEAGIEITAKPPGKQMRSIHLLSGGEKCLTAMALLFAIFEVKPAPFCILDEIDAPLDDTNVERFANIVKQYINRCQFIIITHNKRTMAIADTLFGVSMEEKGVSKLLSMEFAKNNSSEPVLI